jgi:hypothetical protein
MPRGRGRETVFFDAAPRVVAPIFATMSSRPRRFQPLPSFGPRRIRVDKGAVRLVLDDAVPVDERPLQIELAQLERFSALMAAQGWPAHVSRLAYDRLYAAERFGFAKRVGHGALPALARELIRLWRSGRTEPVPR